MQKKRVVAYIRVSTGSDAQLHSYEFQEQYWRDKLACSQDEELVGIYADKGISGKSMERRPEFKAMLRDARDGKIDVIYTKSVSRFARNTVELLDAVREMRDIGVEIIFEKENIHTLTSTSEVFLTIAATIAENDLQVDSERMRWSIRHRIENGWFSVGTGVFGYKMTKDNELVIVPEEAEIVREVYARCIAGEGCVSIARSLNARNIKTIWGYEWKAQGINSMIKNEKYKGDAMMGKQIVVDGRQKRNKGGIYGKQYYIENTHEPIVSREIWQQAQEAIESRNPKKGVPTEIPVYPFTGIICCAKCGTHYRHKINSSGMKWAAPIWTCGRRLTHNKAACDNPSIKDDVLREKFVECYNEFIRKRPEGESVITLQELVDRETRDLDELAKLYMQHLIPEAEYKAEYAKSKATIEELRNKISEQRSKLVTNEDFVPITEFDEEKVKKFITKVMVEDYTVTFVFYNGVTYTRTYTNGQAGNKPGWNKKEET